MSNELVNRKVELLQEQKIYIDRINELLAGAGGFNDASRRTCKNLEAAVSASKRPGYFSYYEQPKHLQALTQGGEVQLLQRKCLQLQEQIDKISMEIDASVEMNKITTEEQANIQSKPILHSVKQWFALYGEPKAPESADQYSVFTPTKKVYGGTARYSAFKTQATTMKKGRLTR